MAKPKQVIVNNIQVFNLFVTESKCVNNSVLGYTERKQTISSVGCEGQDCRRVGKTDRLGPERTRTAAPTPTPAVFELSLTEIIEKTALEDDVHATQYVAWTIDFSGHAIHTDLKDSCHFHDVSSRGAFPCYISPRVRREC